jgi:SEFIR domain-containing protein
MSPRPLSQPPYVFVSYSHDSPEHRDRVLSLVMQLRRDGLDAHCDREVIAPAQGWLRWMYDQIDRADSVVVVCSAIYAARVAGRGTSNEGRGAMFEGAIIGAELYEQRMDSDKFQLASFGMWSAEAVPFFLRSRTVFNVEAPPDYERLHRVLTDQSEVDLGPVGPVREHARVAVPPLSELWARTSATPPVSHSTPPRAKALIAIAIDVSGSMAQSMPRELTGPSSRLQAVRDSLEHIGREARRIANTIPPERRSDVRLFAYAFGLRLGALNVADLLTLLRASQEINTSHEIDAATREVEREARQQIQAYSSWIGLAEQYLGREAVSSVARNLGEGAVRQRLLSRLLSRIESLGDTTASLGDLADVWAQSGGAIEGAEDIIFGDTPLTEAFRRVVQRFHIEQRHCSSDTQKVLLVLSDGEPTDGDPRPIAKNLPADVTVVSCFVTNADVTAARTLFAAPDSTWPAGARLMFDMSSVAEPGNPFLQQLQARGWIVPAETKLFMQVNRSDILQEFLGGLTAYVSNVDDLIQRPGQ